MSTVSVIFDMIFIYFALFVLKHWIAIFILLMQQRFWINFSVEIRVCFFYYETFSFKSYILVLTDSQKYMKNYFYIIMISSHLLWRMD